MLPVFTAILYQCKFSHIFGYFKIFSNISLVRFFKFSKSSAFNQTGLTTISYHGNNGLWFSRSLLWTYYWSILHRSKQLPWLHILLSWTGSYYWNLSLWHIIQHSNKRMSSWFFLYLKYQGCFTDIVLIIYLFFMLTCCDF